MIGNSIPPCLLPEFAFICIRELCLHSWVYYKKDDNLISDSEYDSLYFFIKDNLSWLREYDINGYLKDEYFEGTCPSTFRLANEIGGLTLEWCKSKYIYEKGMEKNEGI